MSPFYLQNNNKTTLGGFYRASNWRHKQPKGQLASETSREDEVPGDRSLTTYTAEPSPQR